MSTFSRYTNRRTAPVKRLTKLTKAEKAAVSACAKIETGPSSVLTCAMDRLGLSPNMPLVQYDRLQAASFKAQRLANRAAIRKNYGAGVSGARKRKRRHR